MGEPLDKLLQDEKGVEFERIICIECGQEFYVRSEWLMAICNENIERTEDSKILKTFGCPNGHPQLWEWEEPDDEDDEWDEDDDDDDDDDDGEDILVKPPSIDIPDLLPLEFYD